MGREDRKERVSLARRRAENHAAGFSTSMLKMPDGLRFYELKEGTHMIDVVPYVITKGKDERGGNPNAERGQTYFERTFWTYRNIGPEQKTYVCPSKTFGARDFIQEWRMDEVKRPALGDSAAEKTRQDMIKALTPKERQLFLFYEPDHPEKGLQLFEFSYHKFGKLLDERIQKSPESLGWDLFYFPDEAGMTLQLMVKEDKPYGLDVFSIDFLPRRKPLPQEIINHKVDLDDMLIEVPYEKLKSLFLGTSDVEKTEHKTQTEEKKTEEAPFDRPAREEPKKEEPKTEPEKKKEPKASDFGLKVRDEVTYKGKKCTIVKISPDETSLTLMDENDDIVKAVSPEEVALEKKSEKKKEEPKAEKKTEAPKSAPKDEDDSKDQEWDKDWDE